MSNIFLGVDVEGTKTDVLITDQVGNRLGFGTLDSGNPEIVGYDGFAKAVSIAVGQALSVAKLSLTNITAAGFGIAGLDWPSQRQPLLVILNSLGFTMPLEITNDTILGLLAGTTKGWGVSVAAEIIYWAGNELGELARSVIRQLSIEELEFEIVQIGSVWSGSPILAESMLKVIHTLAPKAQLVRLNKQPVEGAISLARQVALRVKF